MQREPIESTSPSCVDDMLGGASWRELAYARDDIARARVRYTEAVRAARACGLSWSEIGRVLGFRSSSCAADSAESLDG